MLPPVYPPHVPRKRRFDLSVAVLGIVGLFVIWGIVQAARSIRIAEVGFVRYERAQKDLLIDAGLINAARAIRVDGPLGMRLRRETVMVVSRINARRSSVGSGVILRDDARGMVILTAKHVVRHAGPTSIVLSNHDYLPTLAESVVLSAQDDLALIYTAASDAKLLRSRFARHELQDREHFIVMGHPGKSSWVASPGIAERHMHYVFLYCPRCDKGDSGAGVFNARGELTGILVSKVFVDAPSANTGKRVHAVVFFMEPLERARAFVQQHRIEL
jgi:hypothetical protein